MRGILFGIVAVALAWAAGLLIFIASLPEPATGAAPEADGAVVYTGVGGARISSGMSVLEGGRAKRLLISGVHPNTTRAQIAEIWTGDVEEFECCVDLGPEARSTEGNAREVRDWVRAHGFTSLILVTSDYHMPRAMLETRAQLPDATVFAHPVESGYLDANGRPSGMAAWRQFALEYSKYLAVRVRTLAPPRA